MLYELGPNRMTSAHPTFRNWLTVSDHPNLRRDHESILSQIFTYDAIVISMRSVLCYKAFIMLWKLKFYWLWSAINRSVVGAA